MRLSLLFLLLALVVGGLGLANIFVSREIAWTLFAVFLVLCGISFVIGQPRTPPPP